MDLEPFLASSSPTCSTATSAACLRRLHLDRLPVRLPACLCHSTTSTVLSYFAPMTERLGVGGAQGGVGGYCKEDALMMFPGNEALSVAAIF